MIRRILRDHREIILILALFIVLGILYSVTTPLFEAPDEPWHFAFVQHVATGRGLPVQSEKPTHLARQEGSQPPLYYVLAAAATFWIDMSDFPGIVWENPHYGYNVPGIVNDNKNLFIHTAHENFPYHGAVLAIHLARGVSVLMGALAVLFTYLLTLEILPDRKSLAASASAIVAFVPQFLFISGAVSNDSTIVALSALALWMMVRLLTGRACACDIIALGIATGLTALAKVSGLGLVILAVFVLFLASKRQTSNHDTQYALRITHYALHITHSLVAFFAAFLVVAGWWYIRNLMLYGELTGTAMMARIFFQRATPLTLEQLLVQLREVWETFWVGLGWGNIRALPLVYTAIEIFVAFALVGWLVGWLRRCVRLYGAPPIVLSAWIALMLAALVYWMQTTQAPHGRLFFPALPAIAVLLARGLSEFKIQNSKFKIRLPARLSNFELRITNYEFVHLSFVIFLFTIAALAPFALLQPAYAYPRPLSESDVANLPNRVDIAYDGKMQLLGYAASPSRALPGGSIELALYWQARAAMDEDYSIGIRLLDASQRVIGARDSYPGHGMLPTRLWRAGQIIRDTYWVPLAADASAPGVAHIHIALYARETKRDLPAHDPNGRLIPPIVGRLKIAASKPSELRAQNVTQYFFGKQIALVGYDLQAKALTLYWKQMAPIPVDYTVFIHVLDASGKIVAQIDRQPANGNNPTSLWDDGEIVVDSYALVLPADARGAYRLVVGLYRAETGERLALFDAKGNVLGDHVNLGSFEVGQ